MVSSIHIFNHSGLSLPTEENAPLISDSEVFQDLLINEINDSSLNSFVEVSDPVSVSPSEEIIKKFQSFFNIQWKRVNQTIQEYTQFV